MLEMGASLVKVPGGGTMTIVDLFHFFGGVCVGLMAGVAISVFVFVNGRFWR